MARYIDADKVMEKISHITVTVMGGRSYEKTIFGKALNSYREEVLERIEEAPTADVVPKSEVDNLKVLLEMKEKAYEGLKELYDTDTEALVKAREKTEVEVAREIFESIEECIYLYYNKNDYTMPNIEEDIAEIKKQYLEEQE